MADVLSLCEKFIAKCKEFSNIVKQDKADGKPWKYYNNSHRSEPTFEATRKAGKRYTNCAGGVIFAMKSAGVPASALQWYGGNGRIVWLNSNAQANCKKYFTIKAINGKKTVKQCVDDGTLKPGDVITYVGMTHTNAYLGNNKSFDSGHFYCTGSGEGAIFKKWVGSLAHSNKKVAYILRLKDQPKKKQNTTSVAEKVSDNPKPQVYRVRVGIYSIPANAQILQQRIKTKLNLDCFTEVVGGQTFVYCGSYSSKANAEARAKLLNQNGFDTAIITI